MRHVITWAGAALSGVVARGAMSSVHGQCEVLVGQPFALPGVGSSVNAVTSFDSGAGPEL